MKMRNELLVLQGNHHYSQKTEDHRELNEDEKRITDKLETEGFSK